MEFIKVDKVKVGQVWGIINDNNGVDEPSKVVKIAGKTAIFKDGLIASLEQMICENGIFEENMYICTKDAPKENNMEFIKVDEVKVGQVWGAIDDGKYLKDSHSTIRSIDDGRAIFESRVKLLTSQLINDETYVCVMDIPKEEGVEEDDNHDFSDILGSIGQMLAEKDKRYGNSALKPLDIFAKHHSYGARLDEKLARVKNSGELRKNDVADIIGGLVLICRDNGWTDFSDQID